MRVRRACRKSWRFTVPLAVAAAIAPTMRASAQPVRPAAGVEKAATATAPDPPRSPRVASYSIDVELDPARHALAGREVITWTNASPNPTQEIRLHLYWNAWRNTQSTWLRENRQGPQPGDPSRRGPDEWGAVDVTAVRLLGLGGAPPIDLTQALRFIAPDTGNTLDRTVATLPLPAVVSPGETINLAVDWTSRVPRTFARTGRIGSYYFIAQWFPKVGVLEPGRWNAHEFHAGTEFFSDYGTYDVRITVPAGWVVGATGRADGPPAVRAGKATHRYRQDDVHDFAWVTSPDLIERRALLTHGSLPLVEMRLLLQPEHVGQAERHFAATRAALRLYGEWYGPYPYGHVTIVDPAWQSGSGGMEYPTLFTAGTRWLAPEGVTQPEGVTVHEAGHQFWYGLVANNEFEHAWLDEGLNSFSTSRVLAEAFSPNFHSERFFGGFIPWVYRDIVVPRTVSDGWPRYRAAATSDPQSQASWRYFPATGAAITYSKTAVWLHTLERLIGWEKLQRVLSTFFERWRFRHPDPGSFFAIANEVSGRDLTWFFDQVRGSSVFDYGVTALASERRSITGYGDGAASPFARGAPTTPIEVYETTVVVRRHGDAVFPVDLRVTFENGGTEWRSWNGADRWVQFSFLTASRAVSAVVDPYEALQLDVNRTNNGIALRPEGGRAATKWALPWLVWLQDRLLTFGFAF